jgi:GNAT superfamily N-acetyltransferase
VATLQKHAVTIKPPIAGRPFVDGPDRSMGAVTTAFTVERLGGAYRAWASRLIDDHWGSVRIVTRGKVHDATGLPGFVAIKDGNPVGLVTYSIAGAECEVVSLDSLVEGIGIGTALLDAVKQEAVGAGCSRLWLITTNDNLQAVRYYQKRGFTLVTIHRNALDVTRKLKPELPLKGIDDIPLRDEIELEMLLGRTARGG